MGSAHKVVSACLRMLEFGCSAVILGILAKFFHLLNAFGAPSDSRLVYAITMAAISAVASLITLPPLPYSFHCFPIDMALFICWIVCFALLEDLTGTRSCSSSWFNSYWTAYWNPDTGNTTVISSDVCTRWRVVLAFSFIVSFIWLLSGFLGLYACATYHDLGAHTVSTARRVAWWKQPRESKLEKDGSQIAQDQHHDAPNEQHQAQQQDQPQDQPQGQRLPDVGANAV